MAYAGGREILQTEILSRQEGRHCTYIADGYKQDEQGENISNEGKRLFNTRCPINLDVITGQAVRPSGKIKLADGCAGILVDGRCVLGIDDPTYPGRFLPFKDVDIAHMFVKNGVFSGIVSVHIRESDVRMCLANEKPVQTDYGYFGAESLQAYYPEASYKDPRGGGWYLENGLGKGSKFIPFDYSGR